MPTRRGGSKKRRISKRMKIRKRRGGSAAPAPALEESKEKAPETGESITPSVITPQAPEVMTPEAPVMTPEAPVMTPEAPAAGASITPSATGRKFGGYYSKKRRKRARKSKRKNY